MSARDRSDGNRWGGRPLKHVIMRYASLARMLTPILDRRAVRRWRRRGRRGPPPPLFEQRLVRQYAQRFGVRTLVETGTKPLLDASEVPGEQADPGLVLTGQRRERAEHDRQPSVLSQ